MGDFNDSPSRMQSILVSEFKYSFIDKYNVTPTTANEFTQLKNEESTSADDAVYTNQGASIFTVTSTSILDSLAKSKGIQRSLSGKYMTNLPSKGISAPYKLISNATQKIIKLKKTYTIKEAVIAVEPYIKKAGCNFYGVLLRKGAITYNILHPLTAYQLLTSGNQGGTDKYEMFIYFHSNRPLMDIYFDTKNVDYDYVNKSIQNLVKIVNTSSKESALNKKEKIVDIYTSIDYDNQSITLKSRTPADIDDDIFGNPCHKDKRLSLVTHQALTKGIILPYYGTSLLSQLGTLTEATGVHLTPFLSANISITSDEVDSMQKILENSVCTGNESKTTYQGLSCLDHSNLSSAYNSNCIRVGAIAYADSCVNFSRKLYKAAGWLSDYTPVPRIKITDYTALYQSMGQVELYSHLKNTIGLSVVEIANIFKEVLKKSTDKVTIATIDPVDLPIDGIYTIPDIGISIPETVGEETILDAVGPPPPPPELTTPIRFPFRIASTNDRASQFNTISPDAHELDATDNRPFGVRDE